LVARWLSFDKWTLIDADEMRRRRATRPRGDSCFGRLGATLWWAGIVLGWMPSGFSEFDPWAPPFVVGLAMLSVILGCGRPTPPGVPSQDIVPFNTGGYLFGAVVKHPVLVTT
jgi:hypothetical protein